MMSPAMLMDLSKDGQEGRWDLQDAPHISAMNFSMSKMTLPRMKMDAIVVVDGVMSSLPGRPWTGEPVLLACEKSNVTMGSSEVSSGGFFSLEVF